MVLHEYTDGSLEFEGRSSNYRTEEDDDYEYTLTIKPSEVSLMGAALNVDPGGDVFAAIVHRSFDIIKRGESTWMTERAVPFTFHRWAPWVEVVHEEESAPPLPVVGLGGAFFAAFMVAPLGIVVAYRTRKRIIDNNQRGRGMATGALVIAIAITTFFILGVLAHL